MIPMAKRMQSYPNGIVWVRERIIVAVIRECRAAETNNHIRGFRHDAYIMPELKRRDFE